MNLIRYILDFFHINGVGSQSVKYAKGHTYPATDETQSHVEAGIAEVVPHDEAIDEQNAVDIDLRQPTPILIPASALTASTAAVTAATEASSPKSSAQAAQSPEQPAQSADTPNG